MTLTHTITRTHAGPWMVFDVESNGLHGPGFAVGWVVVDGAGATLADGIAVGPPGEPVATFVKYHVLPALPGPTHSTLETLRDDFWRAWIHWRERDAWLAADVPWPVEASFLADCVDDDEDAERQAEGPYPLIDIASVRLAVGLDPLAKVERLSNELPVHNPLADARQSARLLLEALALARPT